MKKFLFLFLCIATLSVSAQSTHPILTREQNDTWIAALRESDLSKRLEMIRERWEEDATFHYEVAANPYKIISEDKPGPVCRPWYIFVEEEGGTAFFPTNPSSEKVAAVSEFLTVNNVSEITIVPEDIQLIYGQRGSCGVIRLKVAENKILEEIEEILLQKE